MSKRNDGNESDVRVRPDLSAKRLIVTPATAEPCAGPVGEQTDLNPPDGTQSPDTVVVDFDWTDLTDVCPGGYSVNTLTVLVMKLLKLHFSRPQDILNPELVDLVYSSDPALSKIRIELFTSMTGDAKKVPAIIVKRGQLESSRAGIGDASYGPGEYARINTCQFSLLVVGMTDAQTEAIAQELLDYLTCISPIMRERLPILDFSVLAMSALQPLSEVGSRFGVQLGLSIAYEHGWEVRSMGVDSRRVILNLRYSVESP